MQVVMYSVHHRTDKLDLMQMSESELKVNPLFFPNAQEKQSVRAPEGCGQIWRTVTTHQMPFLHGHGTAEESEMSIAWAWLWSFLPLSCFSMNRGIVSFTKPELSEKAVRHFKNLAIRVNELKALILSSPTSDRELSLLLPGLFFCRWTLFCQKRTSSKF